MYFQRPPVLIKAVCSDLLFARQDRLPKPQNRNPPQRATAADFGVQGTSVHGRTHKRELADEYMYV